MTDYFRPNITNYRYYSKLIVLFCYADVMRVFFMENNIWESSDQLLFECPNGCGHKYKYRKGLQRHMQYECGVEKQFICNVCSKAFSRSDHLKTHTLLVHQKTAGVKILKKES